MADRPRRFKLGDVLTLVVAAAFSSVLLRIAVWLKLFNLKAGSVTRNLIEFLSVAAGCVLLPLAIALIALSFRDRQSSRGAGFISCIALATAAVLPAVHFATRVATANDWPGEDPHPEWVVGLANLFSMLEHTAGPMIAGAWLALALSGCWRVGTNWIDRVGLLVGASYILLYVHAQLCFALEALIAYL